MHSGQTGDRVPMHCPYCNSNLVDADDGEMLCSSSGALLSEPVSKVFRLRYSHCQTIAGGHAVRQTADLFCPGCGIPMTATGCRSCGQSFEPALLRRLIELNPHPG